MGQARTRHEHNQHNRRTVSVEHGLPFGAGGGWIGREVSMVQAPLRPCPAPSCSEITRGGRCPRHRKQQRRQHEGSAERLADQAFYNRARWKRLRAVKLNAEPLCERCKQQGRTTVAVHVHHVQPRKARPDLAYNYDNLESLCIHCHSKESMTERLHGC